MRLSRFHAVWDSKITPFVVDYLSLYLRQKNACKKAHGFLRGDEYSLFFPPLCTDIYLCGSGERNIYILDTNNRGEYIIQNLSGDKKSF